MAGSKESARADRRGARPRFSVVIPACNEEKVIRRCLDAVLSGLPAGGTEIVVVANGCHDRTAEVAASVDGVHVVTLATASKTAALNAGDAVCTTWPRIYLDADIEVTGTVLLTLAAELQDELPLVGSPEIYFDMNGASALVRSFYRMFRELPYVGSGLVGLGLYGLSAAGRARFEAFPDVVADDLYVQRLFAPSERRILAGKVFVVHVPRTLRALLAVRRRAARGNAEIAERYPDAAAFAASTGSTVRALAALVLRRPRLLPDAVAYGFVGVAARLQSRWLGSTSWERDPSTR